MKKLFFLIFCCASLSLFANPVGEEVISGDLTFTKEEDLLTISQKSDKAIIEWQDFSIARSETTQFLQPSSPSSCLNRVIGDNPSQILGKLLADGQIYLINPNGILVGKEGIIDTASFVGSCANISNANFLKGKALFEWPGNVEICNEGEIMASRGDVTLIANQIKNEKEGKITAKNSLFLLTSPDQEDEAHSFFKFQKTPVIENYGKLSGNSVSLVTQGGNPEAIAINQVGLIEGVFKDLPPTILLYSGSAKTAVSGSLLAPEGEIYLIGKEVDIQSHSLIDVSSSYGGGLISVGNPPDDYMDFVLTSKILVNRGAELKANGEHASDGGVIFLCSEEELNCQGKLSARGGHLEGNGGTMVFFLAKELPTINAEIDLSAPEGEEGVAIPCTK